MIVANEVPRPPREDKMFFNAKRHPSRRHAPRAARGAWRLDGRLGKEAGGTTELAAAAQLPINLLAGLAFAAAAKQEATLQRSRAVMFARRRSSHALPALRLARSLLDRLELRRC